MEGNRRNYVSLVGAGPGAAGLITVAGLECIRNADHLIYDRLIDQSLLKEAPRGCQLYNVGKLAYSHYASQEEITNLIVSCAREGGHVVRLKGGDPYVFGRGGEEALRLVEEGIPFQVVPGVTSAVAGLCYAGVPVTHREIARSFHVITGHTAEGGLDSRIFPRLAALEGTLVFLMGLQQVDAITSGLIAAGKAPDTPAVAVSNAATSRQRTVTGTLADIAGAVHKAGLESPAVICIGQSAAFSKQLNFFESSPLFGKRILVPSAQGKSNSLIYHLEAAGAQVQGLPLLCLETVPGALNKAFRTLDSYTWVLFTSTRSVDQFFEELLAAGMDVRAFANNKIGAVGPATANALIHYGIRPDLVPQMYTADALLKELTPLLQTDDRILLPQSQQANPALRVGLEALCHVEPVDLYRAVPLKTPLCGWAETADAIVFTSALAAKTFCKSNGISGLYQLPVFTIGPATSAALRPLDGIRLIESPKSTMAALADTISQYFKYAGHTAAHESGSFG